MEIMEQAKKKIEEEQENFKGSSKANAIKDDTARALLSFCEQEAEFAQAIIQNDKTLSECCEAAVKDTGNSVSDFEVYSKAVKFYFSTATIHFDMRLDLSGNSGEDADISKKSALTMSLDSLLDF